MFKHNNINKESSLPEESESKNVDNGLCKSMLEFPYYDLMITITKNKSDDWLFVDLINDEFVFTKGDEYIKIILNKEIEFRGATLADFRVILEEKYEIGLLEMSVEPVVKTAVVEDEEVVDENAENWVTFTAHTPVANP